MSTPGTEFKVHSPSRNKENYSPSQNVPSPGYPVSPYQSKSKSKFDSKPAPLSPMSNLKQVLTVLPPANPHKDVESILRKNRSLEEERITMQQRIEDLESRTQEEREQIDQTCADQQIVIKKLEHQNQELLTNVISLQNEIKELKEGDQTAFKRLQSIRKEKALLQSENESLSKNIERMEQYLTVSNQLANNLQADQQLSRAEKQQLQAENESLATQVQTHQLTITELQAVRAGFEQQQQGIQEQVKATREALIAISKERDQFEKELQEQEYQMFHGIALSLKMDKVNQGFQLNFTVGQLYSNAFEQKIPKHQWPIFLATEIDKLATKNTRNQTGLGVPRQRQTTPGKTVNERTRLKGKAA